MKALIMAGGLGTRLGALTKKTPKPMISIGERAVLEHIVRRLNQHGIDEIMVKVHYLPQEIMKVLGDRVMYYYEPVLFSQEETLKHLRGWLQGQNFFLINGDTISEVDYTDMLKNHYPFMITALMDEWRCAGTWIYPENYFDEQVTHNVTPYRPKVTWFDIGTPERLEAAKKHFELGEKTLCP